MNETDVIEELRDSSHLTVVLIRHGQTEWNHTRRFLGCTDIELDAEGNKQAVALSARMAPRLDAAYTSPLLRASQTAAAHTDRATKMPRLAELDQGDLEGMEAPQAIARFPKFFAEWAKDPGQAQPPGGELLSVCQARVIGALDEVEKRHSAGEVIGIFSHQMALSSLLCSIAGVPLHSWRDFRLPNCGFSVLGINDKGRKILHHRKTVESLGIIAGSVLPDV